MAIHSDSARRWVRTQKRSLSISFRFWSHRWRSAVIRIAEKILIGDSISSIVVQDVSSLSRMKSALSKVLQVDLIQDAEIIRRPFSVDQNRFPSFGDARRAIFRYHLKDTVIHLESGLANVCEGFLAEELFGHYSVIFSGGTVAHEYYLTTRKVLLIKGCWTVLAVPKFYFHFVAQQLPTLIRCLEDNRVEGVLASTKMPQWAKEALSSLGIKVVYVSEKAVQVEDYVCCSAPQVSSRSDVEIIRERFGPYLQGNGQNIAFIGRGLRSRNLGSLEDEIATLVSSLGGTVIEPESLGWENQLKFFSSCSHVIMVYGSAMANAVWMKPGSQILMLSSFEGFTTQIEKSLFEASGVKCLEFDTSGLSHLNESLNKQIVTFINSL
jgi:hypothetical protein